MSPSKGCIWMRVVGGDEGVVTDVFAMVKPQWGHGEVSIAPCVRARRNDTCLVPTCAAWLWRKTAGAVSTRGSLNTSLPTPQCLAAAECKKVIKVALT